MLSQLIRLPQGNERESEREGQKRRDTGGRDRKTDRDRVIKRGRETEREGGGEEEEEKDDERKPKKTHTHTQKNR